MFIPVVHTTPCVFVGVVDLFKALKKVAVVGISKDTDARMVLPDAGWDVDGNADMCSDCQRRRQMIMARKC